LIWSRGREDRVESGTRESERERERERKRNKRDVRAPT
jgi:hypothetical protein